MTNYQAGQVIQVTPRTWPTAAGAWPGRTTDRSCSSGMRCRARRFSPASPTSRPGWPAPRRLTSWSRHRIGSSRRARTRSRRLRRLRLAARGAACPAVAQGRRGPPAAQAAGRPRPGGHGRGAAGRCGGAPAGVTGSGPGLADARAVRGAAGRGGRPADAPLARGGRHRQVPDRPSRHHRSRPHGPALAGHGLGGGRGGDRIGRTSRDPQCWPGGATPRNPPRPGGLRPPGPPGTPRPPLAPPGRIPCSAGPVTA